MANQNRGDYAMISERQLAANRRNAQRSTGPKTDEGKETSRLNAVKHGLTARAIVLPGENPEAFDALTAELLDEFAPRMATERVLVGRLAGLLWRLHRVPQFETALLEAQRLDLLHHDALRERKQFEYLGQMDRTLDEAHEDPEFQALETRLEKIEQSKREGAGLLGRALLRDLEQVNALSKLSRYETSLARDIERTLGQLRRLRAERLTVDCDDFAPDDDIELVD